MSKENLSLLATRFKDVKKSNSVEYMKFKRRKLGWTETLDKISHVIPDYLVQKLQNQG
jgi:hypothetical protein